jgi:hypothetical protein
VQLLVAVEEGRPRIVGQEVDIDRIVAGQADGVLQNAAHRRLPDTRELEAMPVEVYGMGTTAGVDPDADGNGRPSSEAAARCQGRSAR